MRTVKVSRSARLFVFWSTHYLPLINLLHHSLSPIFVLSPKFGWALFIFLLKTKTENIIFLRLSRPREAFSSNTKNTHQLARKFDTKSWWSSWLTPNKAPISPYCLPGAVRNFINVSVTSKVISRNRDKQLILHHKLWIKQTTNEQFWWWKKTWSIRLFTRQKFRVEWANEPNQHFWRCVRERFLRVLLNSLFVSF